MTGASNGMGAQLERFRICADAYGAERRRWPERDQAVFDAFAATREGMEILAAAERIDGFLDAWPAHAAPTSDPLADRIVAAASDRTPAYHRRRMAWWATAMTMTAALGFAIGFLQAPAELSEPSAEFVAQLLVGPSGSPWIGL